MKGKKCCCILYHRPQNNNNRFTMTWEAGCVMVSYIRFLIKVKVL